MVKITNDLFVNFEMLKSTFLKSVWRWPPLGKRQAQGHTPCSNKVTGWVNDGYLCCYVFVSVLNWTV